MFNQFLEKTIVKSQRCQRNWDLTKTVREEDVKTLATSITKCSSKQNRVFYKAHFITNREMIEKIYDETEGFMINFETRECKKNPQVLANLLVAFTEDEDNELRTTPERDSGRKDADPQRFKDRDVAIGIAAGYLTFTANLLGYSTGCCQCFMPKPVQEILGSKGKPLLLMGIGYPNKTKNRRIDQTDEDFTFPSFSKEIEVEYIS